ncbi:hypothetical protein EDF62_1038 [Leucobacter luti]|uniref:Uncharacterized protein n=2 Tax=Leucobacter luti TaxID=340320 RepID=A0A4R6S609_9MICO|nr:hypothetical protein EDF62_1038 [Leucobacter luti]
MRGRPTLPSLNWIDTACALVAHTETIALVPLRTLTISRLVISGKRKTKDIVFPVNDFAGNDLLSVFVDWIKTVDPDSLVDNKKSYYTGIATARRKSRSVFVSGIHGRFGARGASVNVGTHQVEHEFEEDHAPTLETRFVFSAPKGADFAVFAIERQSNSGSGVALAEAFKRHLMTTFNEFSFDLDTYQQSNAWLQNADILSVTAVEYRMPFDPAKGITPIPVLGQLETKFRPLKGKKHLPNTILPQLQQSGLSPDAVFTIPAPGEGEIRVEVEHDGQKKTYAINHEKTPVFRYVLNEDMTPPLTDSEFIRECRTQVEDCYLSFGLTWEAAWLKKSITSAPDLLKVASSGTTSGP